MLSYPEQIIFAIVLLISLFLSYKSFNNMIKVIGRGSGKLHFDHLFSRLSEAASVFISQKTVLKDRPILSSIHALVAWAFILYMLVNIGDVLVGYISHMEFMGSGTIGNLYRIFVDIFSVLAIIGVAVFLIRRFIVGSERLVIRENVMLSDHAQKGMRSDSLIVGLFIIFHIGFRFVGESFSLTLHGSDVWQPFASGLGLLWSGMPQHTLGIMVHVCWWLALGLILAFVPYFPYSKHAHLFMGPINFLTRPHRPAPAVLDTIDFEDEALEQYGVANLEQLEKTAILDAYACIMCNRCQDVCPANLTGKELSPSALEINKRYFIKENTGLLAKGEESPSGLLEYALSPSALWACTSCGACIEICPVGNEPMLDILNIRRDRVMMESDFPKELEGAFNGMEINQNPWNINEDRLKWAKDDPNLIVKTVEENPDFDILYWVGCAGAFEERGQDIARAFTKIMNTAGVNFSVLGNKESCTGDSARRAGNEYLYSMLAEGNIEALNSAKVKKIVATCPHCLNTLKNEYPQMGGHYEVVHHTEFIQDLIDKGKINFQEKQKEKISYHDPCYLGRHNHVYEAPRKSLKKTGADFIELKRNKENSFCCGAGGGQMWKEEEKGDDAVRRNRFSEVISSGAETLCTACPFCLTMMRDAGKELESNIPIKDFSEIVVESMQ